VEKSVREIELVLEKAGMSGKWPVKSGSDPMQYQFKPSESEGVDFIIERAMAGTADDPLWVVGLGSSTDMASALLKAPEIIDRVVVFWHFRTRWPEKCYNFNVFGDVRAARLLFHSPASFVLFDTGTYLRTPVEETEKRLKPCGELGAYLHEYRFTSPNFSSPTKGFFDLGDIAALLEPELAAWEVTECPEVDWDLDYIFSGRLGSILRCYHVDRDRTFELLFDKMRDAYGG
jgi:inosine-uridine nucleoside N-ribohydrolase